MKIHLSLFVVLLFILSVNSRNFNEKLETDGRSDLSEDGPELFTRSKEREGNDLRRRSKRWQFGYGYNYPPPPPPYFDRRDDRNQQDLLPQILSLLDEISSYLKRPPTPPPQPIYIPYPVPYPVPQYQCSCPSVSKVNTTELPSIPNRWPDMDDTNQNWGFVDTEDASDGGVDDARPISFDPVIPVQVMKRPQPAVEHGSSQAGQDVTTQNPLSVKGLSQSSPPRKPSRCDTAVLSCCGSSSGSSQQQKCFNNLGCESYYTRGNACDSENVARVLDSFTKAYSVLN